MVACARRFLQYEGRKLTNATLERAMPGFLICEQDGPLVTLTMNQPEQRNPEKRSPRFT
jgi:hypothetical protein